MSLGQKIKVMLFRILTGEEQKEQARQNLEYLEELTEEMKTCYSST